MKNITLGRYVPYDSIIHRTDARVKLFGTIVLMVVIFFKFGPLPFLSVGEPFDSYILSFIMYGTLAILIFIMMKIAHIKISALFKQLKMLWFMILILLIINTFTYKYQMTKSLLPYGAMTLCGGRSFKPRILQFD